MSVISQTAEYALRAVVQLAACPDRPRTTEELALATHVPPGYLAKVMQGLGRAGLVRSRRGMRGGFVLGRDPTELTVLDVVNAVDPIERISHCPLGLAEHRRQLCPVHQEIDNALAHVEATFRGTTLADLVMRYAQLPDVCCGLGCPSGHATGQNFQLNCV